MFTKVTITIYTDIAANQSQLIPIEDLAQQAVNGDYICHEAQYEAVKVDELPEGVASFYEVQEDTDLICRHCGEEVEFTGEFDDHGASEGVEHLKVCPKATSLGIDGYEDTDWILEQFERVT